MRLIRTLVFCLFVVLLAAPARAGSLDDEARSVVKLFVTSQAWDLAQPWTKRHARQATCSGFFIEQGILTNAHCVAAATYIEAEIPGRNDKVEVKVRAVNHQVDLALVHVRELEIQERAPKIDFGDLPEHRESVVTVGYPRGGRQISYTEGVVSRIDIMSYAHSRLSNLIVQTDAALNPGNSGGPVFSDDSGDCIGVATQGDRSGEGLGYFVPTPVIRQFLEDFRDGRVEGVTNLGLTYQTLENDAMRDWLGMKPGQSGVRAMKIARGSSADGVIRTEDVLLSINGASIFNDGQVRFRGDKKIGFGYFLTRKQVGEKVKMRVLRGGKETDVLVTLRPRRFSVIPSMPRYDEQPRYLYKGGLVFMAVEPRYLWRWGRGNLPITLDVYRRMPIGEEDLEELVVISQVFDAPANKGYGGSVENIRVESINGKKITRLDDAVIALENPASDGFFHIELESGQAIVLSEKEVAEQDPFIRRRYNIR